MLGSLFYYLKSVRSFIHNSLQIILIAVLSLCLMSCAKKPQQYKAAALNVAPKVTQAMLANRVMELGMSIQHVGQDVTVVVPADKVFTLETANFLFDSNKYFQAIIAYLKSYDIVTMKVQAYTDHAGPKNISLALTERQAQRFTNIIWKNYPKLRMIIAKGLGVSNPVASNSTAQGRSQNRRIEISFRYLDKT